MQNLKIYSEENVPVEDWFKNNNFSAHKIPDIEGGYIIIKEEEVVETTKLS